MEYAILIYEDESTSVDPSSPEFKELYEAYNEYTKLLQDKGVMKGGSALEATSTATTVRVRNDERLTVDGPFAETKEQLGGFYMVECDDLDQAIEFAAKCPGALKGSVEVRPVPSWS